MTGRTAAIAAAAAVCLASAAQADGKFDGRFKQSEAADCGRVGREDGILLIDDDVFYGVEARCDMTAPVNVRDMDAVLYDMSCRDDRQAWTARALFMLADDGGLVMVWDGFAFHYARCPDTVTEAFPGAGESADEAVAPVSSPAVSFQERQE